MGQVDNIMLDYEFALPSNSPLLKEPSSIDSQNSVSLSVISNTKWDTNKTVIEENWDTSITKADRIDYLVSISCGILSGLVDSFFVGELSIDRANEWGDEKVANFVEKVANKHTKYKGKSLEDAIRFLEENYGLAADSVTNEMGGGRQHHLRDFSHHFSIGGLMCSIFTQFSGKVIGTDTNGMIQIVPVKSDAFIGRTTEEKLAFGVINWFFHMVSDMAGSSSSPGKGTGMDGINGGSEKTKKSSKEI